jgi:hypothetical protein
MKTSETVNTVSDDGFQVGDIIISKKFSYGACPRRVTAIENGGLNNPSIIYRTAIACRNLAAEPLLNRRNEKYTLNNMHDFFMIR